MNEEKTVKLGDILYADIENNDYLNELYKNILYNYAIQTMHITHRGRIKDDHKIDCAVDHGGFLMHAVELLGLRRWKSHALATRIGLRQWLLIPAGSYKEEGQRLICSR